MISESDRCLLRLGGGFLQQFADYCLELGSFQISRVIAKDREHQVGAGRYASAHLPNYLVDATPNAVTDHRGLMHFAANHDCNAIRLLRISRSISQTHRLATDCLTDTIDGFEGTIAMKAVCAANHCELPFVMRFRQKVWHGLWCGGASRHCGQL